jgi:hypothetical protein
MIINPVMMRSALKARGVHAAMVSFMKIFSKSSTQAELVSRRGFAGKRQLAKKFGEVLQSSEE